MLLIAVKFHNPSLKDFIRDKNDEISIAELSKIYITEKPEDLLLIKKKIFADTVETAETSIPFKEAYFSRKYRFSQWNAIIFTIMQQVTGITFILFFVTFILQEFKKQGSLDLDVTRGAIIVNLFNLFCASASSIPMAYFG
jgi:hypothetical protein